MHTLVLERKYDYNNRLFALCESCYWTATILAKVQKYHCPACHSRDVALIPLSMDEKYEYSLERGKGLQISFTMLERITK